MDGITAMMRILRMMMRLMMRIKGQQMMNTEVNYTTTGVKTLERAFTSTNDITIKSTNRYCW